MHRSTLVNPFELGPDRPEPVLRGPRPAARAKPICSQCHSDDIVCQAIAQWSNEAQEWQLASTFGQPGHCNSCQSSCEIVWLNLN